MTKKQLKLIINLLFEKYDSNLKSIATALINSDLLKEIELHTNYLEVGSKISQRLYHILSDLKSIGKCNTCGNLTAFISFYSGYRKHCSKRCSNKDIATKEKSKQTCLLNFGVENASQSSIVKEKKKITCLEKYGVDQVLKATIVKEKSKQTCIEKYGVENISKTDVFKETMRTFWKDQLHKDNMSEKMSGEKHWNWKGGKSFEPYASEFNRKLKAFIRKRDNYTCQECG